MNIAIITEALSIYGLTEAPGTANNPFILQMAKDCGFKDYISDSIAWCGLAANWVCMKAGYERSGTLHARDFLNVGEVVTEPELGDAVIFWRDSPEGTLGHIAFYINKQSADLINVIGGNQADKFWIEAMSTSKLLGYRRLKKLDTPIPATIMS